MAEIAEETAINIQTAFMMLVLGIKTYISRTQLGLPGVTQHANETINILVEVWFPKHKYHGLVAVPFPASAAVLYFNGSYYSILDFQNDLQTPATEKSTQTFTRIDILHMEKS